MKNKLITIPALCLSFILNFGTQAQDCNSGVYKIYIATDGNDSNQGTPTNEILTLERANEILEVDQPNCSVEVHIRPGTYEGQSVSWTFINGKTITFMPADNQKGIENMPRFISDGSYGWGGGSLEPSPTKDPAIWFDLRDRSGRWTYVRHKYIWVEGYGGAVRWYGDREDEHGGWQGRNFLYGMYFKNIGGRYNNYNKKIGYSAVTLMNSRQNDIQNSHFINIENCKNYCPGCMHGVYLSSYSSDNYVASNKFTNITGNPVQNRDASNRNRYEYNTFIKTGYIAQVQDWYCEGNLCTKQNGIECPSYSVKFYNNTFGTLYNGIAQPKVWEKYGQDDHCGLLPDKRIRTFENIFNKPKFSRKKPLPYPECN